MFFLLSLFGLLVTSSAHQNDDIRDGVCREYNIYYKIKDSCDSYVECHAHKATHKTCPDGLHFIRDVKWPQYPCAYPSDAKCDSNDAPQKAMPTPECKQQYGFFTSPLASRYDCGKYRMCVEGKAFEMECSTGLAFNPESGRCVWPELVPFCEPEVFHGFKYPPATYDEFGKAFVLNGIQENYHYCFSWMEGVGRMQLCDTGYAFNTNINRCVDATRVHCTGGINYIMS